MNLIGKDWNSTDQALIDSENALGEQMKKFERGGGGQPYIRHGEELLRRRR